MKNSSTRILTITVVLLLLANIVLVYLIVTRKDGPRKEGRRDPFEMMSKELQMTGQQQKDYKSLKEEHFKNVRPLFDSLRISRTAFFGLMKQENVTDSMIDAYDQRILSQQARLDRLTFEHFRRVRALFTPEQLPKYDSFIVKMTDRRRGSDKDKGRDKK